MKAKDTFTRKKVFLIIQEADREVHALKVTQHAFFVAYFFDMLFSPPGILHPFHPFSGLLILLPILYKSALSNLLQFPSLDYISPLTYGITT